MAGAERARTGIPGLDQVLHGGLPRGHSYLVHGGPGTGKTTLGLHFLMEGARLGERVILLPLLQTAAEIRELVDSHGWSLDGIDIEELPEEIREASITEQTVFRSVDIEMNEVMDAIIGTIRRNRFSRLVLDSLSELSVLVDNPRQLRHQIVGLQRELGAADCTAILTGGEVEAFGEQDLSMIRTLMHGDIALEQATPLYGAPRRSVQVRKMRAATFAGGFHDMQIRTGGIEVYPRLVVESTVSSATMRVVASGTRELDDLLGGGLEEGTACLITGTSGAGKSLITSLYAQAGAERGEKTAIFCFDERKETFLRRASGLGLTLPRYLEQGLIELTQVNVGEISLGEFVHIVRSAVDSKGAHIVILDSLTGYLAAMPDERLLIPQLHELVSYLSASGVLTLMVVTTPATSEGRAPIDASYLADTVILVRHFEAGGHIRRCIAAIKKRHGDHEKTIRELEISARGVRIGPPLVAFSGVLSGQPRFHGKVGELMTPLESD